MRKRLVVLAVGVVAVFAAFAGAASPTSFVASDWCKGDSLHDAGAAPDITTVCIGSISDGTIEMRVRTAARISSKDILMFSVDSDLNRRTGATAGFDYWVGSANGHMVVAHTKPFKQVHLPSFHGFVRNNDLILILNSRDIHITSGFRFYAWSQRGQTYGDDAPNGGAVFTYRLPR